MPPFDVHFGAFFDVSFPTGGTLVHELVSDSATKLAGSEPGRAGGRAGQAGPDYQGNVTVTEFGLFQ